MYYTMHEEWEWLNYFHHFTAQFIKQNHHIYPKSELLELFFLHMKYEI